MPHHGVLKPLIMVFNVKLKNSVVLHSEKILKFHPICILRHGTSWYHIMCWLEVYKAKTSSAHVCASIGNPSFWTLETLALHLAAGLVRGFLSWEAGSYFRNLPNILWGYLRYYIHVYYIDMMICIIINLQYTYSSEKQWKNTNNLSKPQGFLWCSEVTKASSCVWSLLHPSLQTWRFVAHWLREHPSRDHIKRP